MKNILYSRHFGVPKIIRKLVLAHLKDRPTEYTRANRVLSGFERRLRYSVTQAARQILDCGKAAATPCFVDCGFNEGDVLAKFAAALPGYSLAGYEIQRDLYEMVSARYPASQLKNAAVSDRAGTTELFQPRNFTYSVRGGTTIMADKLNERDVERTAIVDCVDFRAELQEIRKNHDFVVVKMDIEGAEYHVLERVFEGGELLIDFLIIEFHPKSVERARHEALLNRISELKLPVVTWY